ncbi:MAG TPA: DUF6510 family protein [Streptosporangiaceae bacterium]
MNWPSTGESVLDGNALAGALAEMFTVEVTAAVGRCASCLRTAPLADTVVYVNAPGMVARCRGCGAVLLRVVRAPGRAWIDLRGLQCLEMASDSGP